MMTFVHEDEEHIVNATKSFTNEEYKKSGGKEEPTELCRLRKGRYIRGRKNTIGKVKRAKTDARCARRCLENPSCRAWIRHQKKRFCWLKSSVRRLGRSKLYNSGVRCKK